MARQRCPYAEIERIARGQHTHLAPLGRDHRRHGIREGAQPLLLFTADDRGGQLQMSCAAEDQLGASNGRSGLLAQASQPIFADADYRQPGHCAPPVERGE